MQIYRYKLENNTLNNVLDCDSNEDYDEKDRLRGTEVIFGETYGLVTHRRTYFNVYIVQSVLYIGTV